jgi:hypothetical protein
LAKDVINQQDEIDNDGYENIVVISGITATAPQLNVRYWVKTDSLITDGRIRSEVLIKVLDALHQNGVVIKKE